MARPRTEIDENGYDRPSKSQVKREMHALLDLGKRLIELSDDRLKQLDLGESLMAAIKDAKRISPTAREGRRRQIHYVGKLMRNVDPEPILKQLDVWENGSKEDTRAMHRLEALRDLLLRDDDALTEFMNEFSGADIQQLRTLIRAARKEAEKNSTLVQGQDPQRKHYRALYQLLDDLLLAPVLHPPSIRSATEAAASRAAARKAGLASTIAARAVPAASISCAIMPMPPPTSSSSPSCPAPATAPPGSTSCWFSCRPASPSSPPPRRPSSPRQGDRASPAAGALRPEAGVRVGPPEARPARDRRIRLLIRHGCRAR